MSEGAREDGENRLRDAPLEELSDDERSQVAARLRLSPTERLRYLMDMIAFEELARSARRIG
jgi:hypothetical protein